MKEERSEILFKYNLKIIDLIHVNRKWASEALNSHYWNDPFNGKQIALHILVVKKWADFKKRNHEKELSITEKLK